MLDSNLKTQLKGYSARISQPVEIVASLDEGDEVARNARVAADIESVIGLVRIEVQRDDARDEALVRSAPARGRIPGPFRRLADGS